MQTFSTIGYGYLYPKNDWANLIVTFESAIGLIGQAVMTGLVFAKFSRPTAKVLFSKNMIITNYNGRRVLLFRAANARENQILNANITLAHLKDTVTAEGVPMKEFNMIPVVKDRTPIFYLSMTIMHAIDEKSPLYGLTPETIGDGEREFIVTLNGHDETFGQTVHAIYNYNYHDILWDKQFVDILSKQSDGSYVVDYNNFHNIKSN